MDENFLIFMICCVLILLIVFFISVAAATQIQLDKCTDTPAPFCYTDWKCIDPANPDLEMNVSLVDSFATALKLSEYISAVIGASPSL